MGLYIDTKCSTRTGQTDSISLDFTKMISWLSDCVGKKGDKNHVY